MNRSSLHLTGGPTGDTEIPFPPSATPPPSICHHLGGAWRHYTHQDGTEYTYSGACVDVHHRHGPGPVATS